MRRGDALPNHPIFRLVSVLLYWEIGRRIRQDILREKRAEYGEQIVSALSRQLSAEFGRGFSRRNLFNMIGFAEVYPDPKIVQALTAQLGWTHWSLIIYLDAPLKRDFYAEMCRVERWNSRTLAKKIQSMLFERTALSRKRVCNRVWEKRPRTAAICHSTRKPTPVFRGRL